MYGTCPGRHLPLPKGRATDVRTRDRKIVRVRTALRESAGILQMKEGKTRRKEGGKGRHRKETSQGGQVTAELNFTKTMRK